MQAEVSLDCSQEPATGAYLGSLSVALAFPNNPSNFKVADPSLRRRSSAARLLRLWVRIPPGARIFVCCEFYVLCRKTVRKQVKIKRSNRWATPEATTPLTKIKSE